MPIAQGLVWPAALSLPMFTKRLGDGQIDTINRRQARREVERTFPR